MNDNPTVLLLGATGRTGSRVLEQLHRRGVPVRAIVRSSSKIAPELRASPLVTLIEAELLSLDEQDLRRHLDGCEVVISCLGHNLTFAGVFGPPRDLVTRAIARVAAAARAGSPDKTLKIALMSSVSVQRPGRLDTRRRSFERACVALLRVLVPPARDNQTAADLLAGSQDGSIEWVVVRPDSLIDGEVSEYALHEGLVASLFAPASSRMANVAHFLVELATNPATWARWRGQMPVLVG